MRGTLSFLSPQIVFFSGRRQKTLRIQIGTLRQKKQTAAAAGGSEGDSDSWNVRPEGRKWLRRTGEWDIETYRWANTSCMDKKVMSHFYMNTFYYTPIRARKGQDFFNGFIDDRTLLIKKDPSSQLRYRPFHLCGAFKSVTWHSWITSIKLVDLLILRPYFWGRTGRVRFVYAKYIPKYCS